MRDSGSCLVVAEILKREYVRTSFVHFGNGRVGNQYRCRKWEGVIRRKIENRHLEDIAGEGPSDQE